MTFITLVEFTQVNGLSMKGRQHPYLLFYSHEGIGNQWRKSSKPHNDCRQVMMKSHYMMDFAFQYLPTYVVTPSPVSCSMIFNGRMYVSSGHDWPVQFKANQICGPCSKKYKNIGTPIAPCQISTTRHTIGKLLVNLNLRQ